MSTSFDEARACPKCGFSGDVGMPKAIDGHTEIPVVCRNSRCVWFETGWVFTHRADGTIPDAVTSRDKTYVALPPSNEEAALRYLEQIQRASTLPNSEIR